MKFIQIKDNGKGVAKNDLPIICQRFTTSKIREFDDLRRLDTFGFRGEALASISHIAHVNIVSKTSDSTYAYKASYEDGELEKDSKTGIASKPQPAAGNDGTTITIEDLFFNSSLRRNALRKHSEEYSLISELVMAYALHNNQVSFSCKHVRL